MTDDPLDAAMEYLPPASELQGKPGSDVALQLARSAALLKDRALGFTYAEMAARHGYGDPGSARNALVRALRERVAENITDLRAIENERYEMDQRALRLIIGSTDTEPALRIRAIDARTRASARHSRLNGLDAPLQVQVSAGVQQELQQVLAEVESLLVPGEVLDVTDEPYPEPMEA